MAWQRPLHQRIAALLGRLDGEWLAGISCFFGGGTQLVMSHGEYRESRDIDLLVSDRDGYRRLREEISDRSLGCLLPKNIELVREVRADRDAIRTLIRESSELEPLKLEIILEGRIDLRGELDAKLGVPALRMDCAIAEKMFANADRGLDESTHSRDLVDLAFVCPQLEAGVMEHAFALAAPVYGAQVILRGLRQAREKLEDDAGYRARCIQRLAIRDANALRTGLTWLAKAERRLKKQPLTGA